MTPDDLAAIKARCDATPGEEWCWGISTDKGKYLVWGGFHAFDVPSKELAEFISSSKKDVPLVIAELEAAWAEIAELRQAKFNFPTNPWKRPERDTDLDDALAHLLKRMPVEWIRERLAEREAEDTAPGGREGGGG